MSVYIIDKCERFVSQRAGCGKAASPDSVRGKNIGVRPHEIHIKKIKQNQKFYKRNIKYLVKAYHK